MNNERSEIQNELKKGPCADCGFLSAKWASLTRGVVVCSDCYAQHTYLGPSVSFCQFIETESWDIEHLRLLLALHKSNANKIWENTVSETKWKKPAYPQAGEITKMFVKEKYCIQGFIPKLGAGENQDSLNNQLIACARSDFVNVTLRLLVLGANVNYQDEDTGDTALHVAAREGNSNQIELLFLYGADLAIRNKQNLLAHQVAAENGNIINQNQLIRLHFYFTDRFTYFLCKRKPDHSAGKHFYLPTINQFKNRAFKYFDTCQETILHCSDSTLYEMSQDFYDEINRRDNLAVWHTKVHVENNTEPNLWFLPPNPHFCAARNQRRQKFGKMSLAAFECFIYHMIREQKRRFNGEPATMTTSTPRLQTKPKTRADLDRSECDDALPSCSPPVTRPLSNDEPLYDDIIDEKISLDDILEIKEKLAATENIVHALTKKNESLTKLVHNLTTQNSNINAELFSLKEEINKINRNNVNRRIPSPFGADSTERSIPIQYYGARQSEDRIDGNGGGARWRSSSSDRRNSNDVRPVETRIESVIETTPSARPSRRNRDELNFIIQQGEHITKYIRLLIEKGQNGNTQKSTIDGLYSAVNILIQHLPNYISNDKIQSLIDSLVQLSAKCQSPSSNAGEIAESAQILADKLRIVLLDV